MDKQASRRRRTPETVETLIVLFFIALVVGGGLIGWVVGRETSDSTPAEVGVEAAPPGHTGEGLPAGVFGDSARGAELWNEKSCSDCHSLNGVGGTDAPPLDYMREHVSVAEVANMSGLIWNHLPQMLPHFEEEGIPFPTFEGDEMADLIAFLHSSTAPVADADADGALHSNAP